MAAEELDIWGKPITQTHGFKWALSILKAGGKVRRKGWGERCYIRVNEHNILVFFHDGGLSPLRKQMETAHHCDWLELSARDWMLPQ